MGANIPIDKAKTDKNKGEKEHQEVTGRVRAISKQISRFTVQKMINRFLTSDRINKEGKRCLRYTKEELAKRIIISVKEIEKINKKGFSTEMDDKIALPLIELYCSTKWADD